MNAFKNDDLVKTVRNLLLEASKTQSPLNNAQFISTKVN